MISDVLDFSIEDLRELVSEREDFPATEPRYLFDDVPAWFIAAMRKLSPDSHWWEAELPGGDGEASIMVFDGLGIRDYSWFDHEGWVGHNLISEPYKLEKVGIAALESFCLMTGTSYWIGGESFHNPTRTLRITISPIK